MNNILPSMKSINLNSDWHIILYLLRFEWQKHNKIIQWAFCVWFLGIWTILIFHGPNSILFLGMVFGMLLGTVLGGKDVNEQSEEFSFCLPCKKEHIYISRLLFGLFSMLFFCGIGITAIRFSLPQYVWGVFVDSGLTIHSPIVKNGNLYGMAITMPLCIFSFSYFFSIISPTEKLIRITFMNSLFLTLAVLEFTMFFDVLCQIDSLNTFFRSEFDQILVYDMIENIHFSAIIAFLSVSIITWIVGYKILVRKEGVSSSKFYISFVQISLILSVVILLCGFVLINLHNLIKLNVVRYIFNLDGINKY